MRRSSCCAQTNWSARIPTPSADRRTVLLPHSYARFGSISGTVAPECTDARRRRVDLQAEKQFMQGSAHVR